MDFRETVNQNCKPSEHYHKRFLLWNDIICEVYFTHLFIDNTCLFI